MKLAIIVLCLVALVAAAPQRRGNYYSDYSTVQVLRYFNENSGVGSYSFGFEQSDGNKRQEQGELRNEGREDQYLAVKGSYSWVSPDGIVYTVTYVADDKGYQPEVEQGPGEVPAALAATLLGAG
ncbi:endocuticle structural glycoprotein ABD-5-like [Pectinophora gossypiella]|uniref:endocuticle structural glycoprotein ABD-5-like n=1 Tax=Pectinophora gossypiella TaxID=13191 RepID=UPI00214F47DB|nr:endocuticle structural glycoprotein ABD-5-like [Pectinophora gossypiella]